MTFKIKLLNIECFKGISERRVIFDDGITRIDGKNASGKTTIATAFFWLMNNTDYDLKTNPPIFPLNMEECTPTVELVFEIDGKVNRIKKAQTRKVTVNGDTRKVALSNAYFYNDVPVSETAYKSKLTDLGFDFDKFEALSHPDAFLACKKDDMRKILFGMVSSYTDRDIALLMESEVMETAQMLSNYTMDEIKATQNQTLRKINEIYGKKGEILNAKIEGLELSKVEYEYAALELLKSDLEEKLNALTESRKTNIEVEKKLGILREKSLNLQMEVSGLRSNLSAEKNATLSKLKKAVDDIKSDLDAKIMKWRSLKTDRASIENKIAFAEKELSTEQKYLSQAENMVFEGSTNCPYCGQRLPETDIQKAKDKFDSEKAANIAKFKNNIEETQSLISDYRKRFEECNILIEKANADGKVVQDAYNEANKKYEDYKLLPDNEPTEELIAKEQELASLNNQIEEAKKLYIPGLDIKEAEYREQLKDTELKLNQAHTNALIDEKIEELRTLQAHYEQDRANAEKILYQLDLIQKRKNELLTEEINKHFSLVRWKFFDALKNGTYIETCIPMVDGKELGASLNTAMQIRAKIDICNSLQKFYDQHMVIFLDGAEALDSESQEKLNADTQMVLLSVKD